MSISRVNGTVEEQRGVDSARIRVISFKRNRDFVTSTDEIKNQFPPVGFVFSPHFFKDLQYKINSLIEFSVIPTLYKIENGDEFLLDTHKECKLIGFPVFELSDSFLINNFSINQSCLKNSIQEEASHFYIRAGSYLYGPFKNTNGEIIPKTGREVNRYEYDVTVMHTSGDRCYLLNQPETIIDKIDCMTPPQLGEWLKGHLKTQLINFDFNVLKKAIEIQQLEGLNKARIHRVLNSIDQISLSITELKALADSSENFNKLYIEALNKRSDELKTILVEPFESRKILLEGEIEKLVKKIKEAKKEDAETSQKLENVRLNYKKVLQEKERLIEDIRVHALIKGDNSITDRFTTYEEQIYQGNGERYKELNEFVTEFNNSLGKDEETKNNYGQRIIFQFKDKNCFLTDTIDSILQLAALSGNCKAIIQQVEPDWLKFEYLFKNGLSQIWKSAYENSSQLHFLILEDINMASIECYGKPILDMLSGIRLKLPGLLLPWPRNLWVFGIPLLTDDDIIFGLPLIESTFSKWGSFPKGTAKGIFRHLESKKFLTLEKLIGHDLIVPSSISDYFIK